MKRSPVFIPVVILVLSLLYSFFVPAKNEYREKPVKEELSFNSIRTAEKRSKDLFANKANRTKPGLGNIVFRSTDGGQTWEDISEGLSEKLQREGVQGNGFFANDSGLYILAGNGIYHLNVHSAARWIREAFPGKQRNIYPGKNGIFAYSFRGEFLFKTNGTSKWSPVYTSFQQQAVRINRTVDWMYERFHEKEVRSIFETAKGTVFIGSSNSLFKSSDLGKTWKQVYVGSWVMKLTELNGVLLATNKEGILRSVDDGENWELVINEGGNGITVESIDGGFAAIAYNPITRTNRIHISLDAGKNWNTTGEGLQPAWNGLLIKQLISSQPLVCISSIKQVGKYLICSRSDGIFGSPDMGKTWKLLLPSTENRGFKLAVGGNVIYAIPNKGC